MTFDPDDPRLTAYALGELDEPDPALEALLAENPEARQTVDEIRATARLLTEQLGQEPSPGLRPGQHLAIESGLQSSPQTKRARSSWVRFALAASVVLALGGALVWTAVTPWELTIEGRSPLTPPAPATAPRGERVLLAETEGVPADTSTTPLAT